MTDADQRQTNRPATLYERFVCRYCPPRPRTIPSPLRDAVEREAASAVRQMRGDRR